jgi:hypothetical protein
MQMEEEYANVYIDEDNFYDQDEDASFVSLPYGYVNEIVGKEIIQLKNNIIPKGLVPIEKLFDANDVAKNPKVTPNDSKFHDFNIGTDKEPKFFKLSKSLTLEKKKTYLELMRQISDMFS